MNFDPYTPRPSRREILEASFSEAEKQVGAGAPEKPARRSARRPAPDPALQRARQLARAAQEALAWTALNGTLDDFLSLAGYREADPKPKTTPPPRKGGTKKSKSND